MRHELTKPEAGSVTAGGNPVCTCGVTVGPGGFIPHLQQKLEEVEEEAALWRRNSEAQYQARLAAGVTTPEGRRLF